MYGKRTCHLKRGLLILSKKYFFLKILKKNILIGHNPLASSYCASENWGRFRTISVTCIILCQRLIVPNLISICVVLGRSLGGNNCSKSFYRTWVVIKNLLFSKTAYLTACLNNIKFLIGKYFFCYFEENLGTH